jgi:hypothetical protein
MENKLELPPYGDAYTSSCRLSRPPGSDLLKAPMRRRRRFLILVHVRLQVLREHLVVHAFDPPA